MAELLSYLPEVLHDIREFRLICEAGDFELAELHISLADIVKDNFIQTLTERGCERWERMMRITPKASDDIEVRRFRILAQLNEQLPYTYRGLLRQLETLCGKDGYSAELNSNAYTLSVRVALTAKNQLDEVMKLLKRVVPANLVVSVTLKYNQHKTFAAMTHGQLSAYTHYSLRNEVFT